MGTLEKLTDNVETVYKYLRKAIEAREAFYKGMDMAALKALTEKQPNMGPEDAKYRFGESVEGKQLVADNKWHMTQSRTFALATIATTVLAQLMEQKKTNLLLEQQSEMLGILNDNLIKVLVATRENNNG
jgi:hypothetical protein